VEASERPRSALEADIRAGRFVLTASLGTLKGFDGSVLRHRLRDLSSRFRIVKFGDNPRAQARPSAWAAAAIALEEDLEPVVHVTCRDRNRLAIAADLLGGRMLGVRNVLCLRGDEIDVSDDDRAGEVRDLDVVELIRLAGDVGEGGYFLLAASDPEAGATASQFARLADKLAAGALVLETQPIFEPERFATWLGRLREAGIAAPVLVDVFVVKGPEQVAALREVPFIAVPGWLEDRLRRDEASGIAIAAEIVAAVRDLPGVAGCHLSSFGGLAEPPLQIAERLGFDARGQRTYPR
jgi:methylenetetrahydrofolate reductase (NADPH)